MKFKDKLLLKFVFVFLFSISGCSNFANIGDFTGGKNKRKLSCAGNTIERAFKLHENAKYSLALFFEERSDDQLYKAFYSASDSVRESQKVKKCWDRKRSHYYAMQNLREMNTSLARIIRRNLPDDDNGEMIAIYNDQFELVMPHMR